MVAGSALEADFSGSGWAGNPMAEVSPVPSLCSSLCLVFPYHPVDLADALNYRRLQCFASDPPLRSFCLPSLVVQSIAHDILSALKHLQEHCIIHRDVKPGNLYVTNQGEIQLGDFGLGESIILLVYRVFLWLYFV